MTVRRMSQPRGWAFTVAVAVLKPLLLATTRRRWIDGLKLPESRGCVVVMNHISHVDPLLIAHLVYDHGRLPRYLAKSALFRVRFLGPFLHAAGQIPVERRSPGAAGAYDEAVEAVREGACLIVYPEGTITRDPELWPMTGKSGAARIALATGCPVVPIGQWGAHRILPPYTKRPHLFPRRMVTMKVGDPVGLVDLMEQEPTPARTQQATDRIMQAVTDLVADIRQEQAPPERFDPRSAGVREFGNPHRKDEQ